MLEESSTGCYESSLINGNGEFHFILFLITKVVEFWFAVFEGVDVCMLEILNEAGLALEELCIIVAGQGLTVLIDLA